MLSQLSIDKTDPFPRNTVSLPSERGTLYPNVSVEKKAFQLTSTRCSMYNFHMKEILMHLLYILESLYFKFILEILQKKKKYKKL